MMLARGQFVGGPLRFGGRLGLAVCFSFVITGARADLLPEALAKAYQTNPQLNAERARLRATDENVPQALAGYRPLPSGQTHARYFGQRESSRGDLD